MNPERLLLVATALWLLTGMRDPFAPQPDPCQTAQLTRWHYQGFAAKGDRITAIVKDAAGKWQRIGTSDVLPGGWRIESITEQQITILTAAGCEPQQWQWTREGKQSEAMDSDGHAVQRAQRESGKTPAGHAGGG